SRAFVRALDQPWKVGDHELALVHFDDAELRMQRRKRIVGDLRLRRADGGKERGLACVGQADQPGIRNQLQPQADRAFLAGLPGVGMAWRAVGRRFEGSTRTATVASLVVSVTLPPVDD